MSSSDKEYFVRGIPADHLGTFWKLAEPYIKRALDRANGELDHHDVRAMIETRDIQLWMVSTKERVVGAVTTEIVIYPRKKVIRVITLAGNDFADWFDLIDKTVSAFGESQGCEGIECFVRPGFPKKLATHGMKQKYVVCYRSFFT